MDPASSHPPVTTFSNALGLASLEEALLKGPRSAAATPGWLSGPLSKAPRGPAPGRRAPPRPRTVPRPSWRIH
jgi:hypothetical protein